MTQPPAEPKLYHITHVDNLQGIVGDGVLWSDAQFAEKGGPASSIGMGRIKERRFRLPVTCHSGDHVADFVPFYFCPRSVMLCVIWYANDPDLDYREGQEPILHLEFDLKRTVAWADAEARRWAFSLSSAATEYPLEFRDSVEYLGEIDWAAVGARDFRDRTVKERKQAEFLVHSSVPWMLVERIGAYSPEWQRKAQRALSGAAHQPPVEVIRSWYY